jgi:hypothetical protein
MQVHCWWLVTWLDLVWLFENFLSLFSFILFAHLEFPCKFLCLWRYSAVLELIPDALSWGGGCLYCCARHFRTANSTPSPYTIRAKVVTYRLNIVLGPCTRNSSMILMNCITS